LFLEAVKAEKVPEKQAIRFLFRDLGDPPGAGGQPPQNTFNPLCISQIMDLLYRNSGQVMRVFYDYCKNTSLFTLSLVVKETSLMKLITTEVISLFFYYLCGYFSYALLAVFYVSYVMRIDFF
jgi:hypothetical protein